MKLVLATLNLISALFGAACLAGCQPVVAEPPLIVVTETAEAPEPVVEPKAFTGLVVLGASWCVRCQPVKVLAGGTEGVRYLDIDADPAEAARLWGGPPRAVPCYVQVIDGEPGRKWTGNGRPMTVPWLERLRDASPQASLVSTRNKTGGPATPATPRAAVPRPAARGSLHSHRCPRCATVWWHTDAEAAHNHVAAHQCPRCRTPQTIVHSFAANVRRGCGPGGCW